MALKPQLLGSSSAPRLTMGQRRRIGHVFVHLALLAGVVIMMIPLAWTVSTSLKPVSDLFIFPPEWIPDPIQWGNYAEAVTAIPFWRYLGNTVFVTTMVIIGKVLSVTLVAFAFARLEWAGRNVLFLLMLATMMLPPHVTLIPQFILFKQLGWLNTFLPLIVPEWFGGPFMTFLVRQFFMTIPLDLDEAARIDGASSLQVYWRVIMPMSRPVIIAVIILVFNNTWNDFLRPLLYLQSPARFTLQLGLRSFMGEASTNWHLLMAASVLTMLPVLVLFFVGQRYFLQGVVFTGVKG